MTLVDAEHSSYRAFFAMHLHDGSALAQGPTGSGSAPVLM
jgi:hypothetical protein